MLAFALGPAELLVGLLLSSIPLAAYLIGRGFREGPPVVRRPCPECSEINVVEQADLGKRMRCAACGSLLYPNEHARQQQQVNIHNVFHPTADFANADKASAQTTPTLTSANDENS